MTELYNKKNKEQLIKQLKKENFDRLTLSFYRYVNINKNLNELRDHLYEKWSQINILGRIYIAKEGINAQISIPENKLTKFETDLNSYKEFKNMKLKFAVEEQISFYKLIIKVKNEIVAYKIKKDEYDINKTGKHLDAQEFNKLMSKENSIVVDMRN